MKKWMLGVLCAVFLLASVYPTIYEYTRMRDLPENRSFELVHNYITDYNFYLSRIREGWDGRWTAVERYTSEPHQGSLIQEFYVLLGRLVRPVANPDVAVPASYHASRIVFGLFTLVVIASIASALFSAPFWAVLACSLAVTASGWPKFVPVEDSIRIGGYMPWWTVLDGLQRITFLPHILLGQMCMMYLIVAGGTVSTLQKHRTWILGGVALLLGLVFPPALVFVLFVYGVMMVWEYMTKKNTTVLSWMKSSVLPRVIIGGIAFPSLLYFSYLFGFYPWKRLVEFDIIHPLPFSYGAYLQTIGPIFLTGIIGVILVIKQKATQWYPMVAWVVSNFMLILFFQYVPLQHPLRFTEMAVHVPLGLLTAYAAYSVVTITKKKRLSPYIGITALVIPFLLLVLGVSTMHSSWLWQKDFVDQKVAAGWPEIAMNNYIVYPAKGFIEAITFIDASLPSDAIILSDMVAGNYIVARTGRTVFVGHDNTVRREEKESQTKAFFSGKMDPKSAYQFVKTERISYVFFGPQEKEAGGVVALGDVYPFLQSVYGTYTATIYQVLP